MCRAAVQHVQRYHVLKLVMAPPPAKMQIFLGSTVVTHAVRCRRSTEVPAGTWIWAGLWDDKSQQWSGNGEQDFNMVHVIRHQGLWCGSCCSATGAGSEHIVDT